MYLLVFSKLSACRVFSKLSDHRVLAKHSSVSLVSRLKLCVKGR